MKKRTSLAILVLAGSTISGLAQPAQNPAKASTQTASNGSKDATCDGGIELIPSGQMTFVRKRYPAPIKKNSPKSSKVKTRR